MPPSKLTLEQRLFSYDTYVKTKSCRDVCRRFVKKFPGVPVPHRDTVRKLVLRFRETGSINDRIPRRKRRVLTEEKLDEIGQSLERSPNKSLRCVSQEIGVSKTSAHRATKLLKLKPYRVTLVHELQTRDNVVRWYSPVTMKLDSHEFKALFTPELKSLVSLFEVYGHELRIAGGAVRDLLMKKKPKDLDFATTATPDQMKEMFVAEGIRMINNKGERHGTITPRINDKENFEVTTLRIDVQTDGRHAQVEFTTDWKLDANRRDLTINSMFLGLDGTVYDYFDGYKDLQERRIAFVGDAETRIKEDYLRILRYFRFYGRIAEQPDNHEHNTLLAIKGNVAGLEKISGERIWSELHKILEGQFAGELMKTMISLGLGPYIGLPAQPNVKEFDRVCSLNCPEKLNPMTLLSALLRNQEEVMKFHSRVKLSAYERDLALFIVENWEDKPSVKPLQPYQLLVVHSKGKTSDTREWVREVLKYRGDVLLLHEFDQWILPRFPVNGNMLKERGVPGGKVLGQIINALKQHWVESDFQLPSDELFKFLPEILEEMGVKPKR